MPHIFRKHIIVCIILFFAFTVSVFAQEAATMNSTVKPFSGPGQFRKFSVGLNAGVLQPSVIIGGSNDYTNPQIDLGYGANLRYQVTHYFALQADFLAGSLKGNQDDELGNGQLPTSREVTSFKTKLQWSGAITGQLTFGNINWLREKSTIVPYLSAGAGLAGYRVQIVKRGSTTLADYDANNNKKEFFVPVGVGLKFNVSPLINLDLGYRMHFVDGDNFDGYAYYNLANPDLSSTVKKDKFSYGFLGVEFALGNKSKPQLLFDNPAARVNSTLQSQIDSVKADLLGVKSDTDGDGIADMFDKEPNTPAGSPVDSHGVTKDTDNDGVPDWKDKQLITPTECQPVDADGVGKCPDPACCGVLDSMIRAGGIRPDCPVDYPSLSLKSTRLSADVKAMLSSVATKLKDYPNCSITLTAYPGASKAQQSLADRKLTMVKNYLVETLGISADRLVTDKMIGGGDANVIDIK